MKSHLEFVLKGQYRIQSHHYHTNRFKKNAIKYVVKYLTEMKLGQPV